jgi:PAS domain-containing protein
MFLLDPGGMLVYYNDAAAALLGRSFAELGEIPSGEFGESLQLTKPDGAPIRRRDSPAGIAFFERRPAHQTLMATTYNGVRRQFEATAYPLFGAAGEMHGVVAVFWEGAPRERNG